MKFLKDTQNYIIEDYRSNKVRFFLEVFSWTCSIITSIIFAATVPNIPVVPLYSIFIAGCCSTFYCAWTRGSFGLMVNYAFLVTIDAYGLVRYLLSCYVEIVGQSTW